MATKSKTPRFVLKNSRGWKTLDAVEDALVLAAFSSYDAAESYCQSETEPDWQLHPLPGEFSLDPRPPADRAGPLLLAIDAPGPAESLLPAATLEAVLAALGQGHDAVDAEYRLIRDCAKLPWRRLARLPSPSGRGAGGEGRLSSAGRWYVACKHPGRIQLTCGQRMWFWLEWFDGRHVRTDHQSDTGKSGEEDLFAFNCRSDAEDFYRATIERLDGTVRHCYLDSHYGDEFEIALREASGREWLQMRGKVGHRLLDPVPSPSGRGLG